MAELHHVTCAVEMLMNIRERMWLLSEVPRHRPIGKEGRREVPDEP